jgi:hypothetical protein
MTQLGVQRSKAPADEGELVARLRAGDEQAFETLVTRYYGTMLAPAAQGHRLERHPARRVHAHMRRPRA